MMHLLLHFLVLRAMILYHIMILVSSVSCVTSAFYMYGMHDTAYDTSIVASLILPLWLALRVEVNIELF
jgi:hypothetical protein